jgi:glutaredoxin
MKKTQAFFSILLVVFFMTGAADARLYKWVDDDGVAHFSDSPPTHGEKAGKVESVSRYKKDGTPSVSYSDYGSPSCNSNSNAASSNGRQAVKSNVPTTDRSRQLAKRNVPKVELYTTSWCPYCKKATNFFRSKGIPFKEYDIEKDKAAARRKKQLDKKGSGVPFAMINGKPIHGYSKAAYENALK